MSKYFILDIFQPLGAWSDTGELLASPTEQVVEVYADLTDEDRDLLAGDDSPPIARGMLRMIAKRLESGAGGLGNEVREAINSINADCTGDPRPILAVNVAGASTTHFPA